MNVKIIATYDSKKSILRVKNEHDVEWETQTSFPEVYLSSLIGASFAIKVKGALENSVINHNAYKLTIEEI